MHHLGLTRSAHHHDHLFHTPDSFVRAPLPGMHKATAIVHAGDALGASFVQYTAEFEAGGRLDAGPLQRFVYVIEGELRFTGRTLTAGGFAYFPAGNGLPLEASVVTRAAVIEKPFVPLDGVAAPRHFWGQEQDAVPQPLLGDPDMEVRALVPADAAYDFAVNTMSYRPGSSLPMVEVHVMEHGLLMLEGGGIYRLNDRWYPVRTGDFIWMGPYCPQWFAAVGKTPAKYLIYKDWNRHPA